MKHVWVLQTRGFQGSHVLMGVFGTFKRADEYVRDHMDGAKYNREEMTWYNDYDYEWWSVSKEEVQ